MTQVQLNGMPGRSHQYWKSVSQGQSLSTISAIIPNTTLIVQQWHCSFFCNVFLFLCGKSNAINLKLGMFFSTNLVLISHWGWFIPKFGLVPIKCLAKKPIVIGYWITPLQLFKFYIVLSHCIPFAAGRWSFMIYDIYIIYHCPTNWDN